MSSLLPAAARERLEVKETSNSAGELQRLQRRTLVSSLALIAAVLVFYSPVVHNGFLNYDDDAYITDNPHVKAGLTWPTVKWAFTTYDQANWHPLTWISHALDIQLFGLHPAGNHSVNVLLHAGNAVLLFLLLQSATGFRWRSLMVASLFALHPMNVESVAWAAERKTVLSTFFFLLALYFYGKYVRERDLFRYALVFLCFAVALLSKPQVIAFPFLLLLWDYWPLNRMEDPSNFDAADPRVNSRKALWGSLVLEKVPFLLLAVASALMTMKAQKAGGALKTLSQYGLALRLETAVISYAKYVQQAFWPVNLVALYPHPTKLYPAWQVGIALVVLLVVTTWVLRARNRPYLRVGWIWFVVSLAPMIGILQVGNQARADRYAYISFVGLFLMLTWLVGDWARSRHISGAWLTVPAVGCLLVLGVLTFRQVIYWHDTESFWRRTLSLTDDNYVANDMLGDFLNGQGRNDGAAEHFRAALAVRPDDLMSNLNLARYEYRRGNLPTAIERYQVVASDTAGMDSEVATFIRAGAYFNLGSAHRQMGELTKAKQYLEMALRLAPGQPTPMVGLGLIAQKTGDGAEAVRQYSQAIALQPNDVRYLLLANALQQEGRSGEAAAILENVARSSPNLREAQKQADLMLAGKQ